MMKLRHLALGCALAAASLSTMNAAEDYTRLVNPFIGTTNFGTTNPGAIVPNGLMSVVPFNVMGADTTLNVYDKDAQIGRAHV